MNTCRLCKQEADLQLSHILPAFVFRWMRESSGNGHIRSGTEPNKRVQDGLKLPWLCKTCEGVLNQSETAFANNLFYPYIEKSGHEFHYSTWLLHFCVSISWRILIYHTEEHHLNGWNKEETSHVTKAELTWREFLLGQRPHPDRFHQHLIPFDQIESSTGTFVSNINRYLMRAIDMDVCKWGSSLYTYGKLGRFVILGFINEQNYNYWKGSKINANKGVIGPRRYMLPMAFADYLNEKAQKITELIGSVSDKQQEKIDSSFKRNADRYIGSDAYQAMLADISMFGDEAFTKRDKK